MAPASVSREDPSENSDHTLVDLTPAEFACSMTMSCPALLKDERSGTYVVIGKIRDPQSPGLRGRVGSDEMAIEISSALVDDAIRPRFLRTLAMIPVKLIQLTSRRLKSS